MNKDDKNRVIGKIVSITTDRFTVELLSGIENFNINGFDDIHYFAQVNSYVVLPYQNYHIVAEIVSIKERDSYAFGDPSEQFLHKNKSVKFFEITPVGTIKDNKFDFGVSVYPPIYSDVLYIKECELDCIFNSEKTEVNVNDDYSEPAEKTHGSNTRFKVLPIGKSTIFENYDIKVDIDKFFGGHSAVLGNTGSGKSCTIASIIQKLTSKQQYSATGSSFIVLDVNGEYSQAFSKIKENNNEIDVKSFEIGIDKKNDISEVFRLPHWFLNIDEWALLLQASEKTQLPILRNALGLAMILSDEKSKEDIKNHILATCITQILRDETSSPSKKDRITSILQKFKTTEIDLDTKFNAKNGGGFIIIDPNHRPIALQKECTIRNCLYVHFAEMKGLEDLLFYLEQKNDDGTSKFFQENFEIPSYKPSLKLDFEIMEMALDIAILYEEAHGNRQIRDYCSSMITRFKSIKERSDYKFLSNNDDINYENYINELLGIDQEEDSSKYVKKSQITVIDLNSADDEVIEIVSCVLSRMLYDSVKRIEPRNSFPVNLILEEAHRYISTNKERTFLRANHIFERIAKEGRKYGMFLIISSQRPSELSKTVLSQCGNFIIHRIQNPEDLSHIRQMTPHISEAVLKRLPSIPTQQALVFGQAVNVPSLFKVNRADPLPRSDNNQVSKNWFRAYDSPMLIEFK
jgi:DNA helicase HerA-like ATPase